MEVGELLFVAALWGVPFTLLWMSWYRYRTVHAAAGTNRSLAGASLALLFLTSGIWLLLFGLAIISDYFKAANAVVSPGFRPSTLAVPNIVVCAVSFILSLLTPNTVQGTIQFQRAITFATGYMVLVWMFALTAH
jgi:hypothetical protein